MWLNVDKPRGLLGKGSCEYYPPSCRSTLAAKKPLLPALLVKVKAAPKKEQESEEQEAAEEQEAPTEEVSLPLVDSLLPLVDSPLPLVDSPLPEGVPDVDTADAGNPQVPGVIDDAVLG